VARRLIFLALLVGACAEPAPPTLAVGSVEAALPGSIWPDDPSLVTDLDCPGLATEVIAQTILCTATLDSDPVTVDVGIDELGAATAQVREPLFVVADAVEELVDRLRNDVSIEALEAFCARTVVIPKEGRVLDCEATDGVRVIAFRLMFGVRADDLTLELVG
jgi:hypothetical protein